MNVAGDRMWAVRDAILLWLYEQAAHGAKVQNVNGDAVEQLAGWTERKILDDEVQLALIYLKDQNFINGISVFGGRVIRPSITPKGESVVASERSLKPARSIPDSRNSHDGDSYTITTNGHTNFSINSRDVNQSADVNESPSVARVASAGIKDTDMDKEMKSDGRTGQSGIGAESSMAMRIAVAALIWLSLVSLWAVPVLAFGIGINAFGTGSLTITLGVFAIFFGLFKEEIKFLRPSRRFALVIGAVAITAVLCALSSMALANSSGSVESTVGISQSSTPVPGPTSAPDTSQSVANGTSILTPDGHCDIPNPSDKKVPDYELCVMNWCQGIVVFPNGAIDESRIQIKLHPRILNNSNTPLDISLERTSALRLLVSSSDLPSSWRPPPATASMGDLPYLVSYSGQNYWAVAPNIPHDVDLSSGSSTGFATFWDSNLIEPNSLYPPLTYKDEQGDPVQQGDLVFQLPAKTQTNSADVLGLALVDRAQPGVVLAVALQKDWGPRLSPDHF